MSTIAARVPVATFHRCRALALLLAGAAVLLGLSSIGSDARSGPLIWAGDGEVFTHPTLPGDRVLTATLRNDGPRPLRVDTADVRLVDSSGREVPATPVFLRSSGRSLWAGQRLDAQLERTGPTALLRPGEEVPLTVAWHAGDGDPVRVDYGRGWLSLPG
jgi:hypothetical protein